MGAFRLEPPGQKIPTAEVNAVGAKFEALCASKIPNHIPTTKKVVEKQDGLDAIQRAKRRRLYCEERRTFLENERIRRSRTEQYAKAGFERLQKEYQGQCKP